jgi:hypothetical protein
MENWKWVVWDGEKYPYEISSLGRLRRDGRILRTYRGNGTMMYEATSLWKNNRCLTATIHRMVALAFLSKVRGRNVVNHKDGDIYNNRVENLEWTDYRGNIMARLYREPRGPDLSKREAAAIRLLLDNGVGPSLIAKAFRVSQSRVLDLKYGKTWRFL